jgi:hypothetical protein
LWLVRAPSNEPCSPGVAVVAVIDDADSKFQLDDRDDIPEWLKDLARRYG